MLQLKTSYKQILKISFPIMLGSAAQNVIALIDSVFLYHKSEIDFAAIGFVGVFYLIIASIGYGFSKGGQIIIARRLGQQKVKEVGNTFWAMIVFELFLALVMFLFMWYGTPYFFKLLVDSPKILAKSLEYIQHRAWGVFFAYAGVSIIALYTGIARTKFIIIDAAILAVVNGVLCYGFVFGELGLPEMGIGGAGLSSSIAELVAFLVFVVYMLFDKHLRKLELTKIRGIDWSLIRQQFNLSTPIVVQSIVGLGSWFIFFGIVENLGERPLAITNLVRMVYLFLSIPTWGYASGVNTMVSGFIGAKKRQAVMPIIWKTAKINWITTMILSLPIALFPKTILYPLLGKSDMSLIVEAQPVLLLLLVILSIFSVGAVYFNGLAGTGATLFGLKLQTISAFVYLLYVYIVVSVLGKGLLLAWASEIVYWAIMMLITYVYLYGKKWHFLKI